MRVDRLWVCAWSVAFAALAAVGPADAQQAERVAKPQESTRADRPAPWDLWPTDKMVGIACDQIGRRYNLTEEQDAYTRALMSQRVNRFLAEYEDRLAARVKREVRNKLTTGLKNPRRK